MSYPLAGVNGQTYTDAATGQSFIFNSAIGAWIPTPGPSGGGYVHEELLISSSGQSIFVLSAMPNSIAPVMVNVNGVDYWTPDWTIAGNIISWLGPVTLETTDRLVVSYTV